MNILLLEINDVNICKILKSNSAITSIAVIMMAAYPDAKQIYFDVGAINFIANFLSKNIRCL